ncbi:MAG: hypothetical protein ABH810_00085 [bacterium]
MNDLARKVEEEWASWKYKNIFLLIISIALFIYFLDSPFIVSIITQLGALGYVGAFLCGILFVSIFTVTPALAILYELASTLNPWLIALFAGLGAVVGDLIIFNFLKDKVFKELSPIFGKLRGSLISKIFISPFFAWFVPILGAFMIAAPLPDELGLGLLGLSKIKLWQFVLVTFILNALGILIVVLFANYQTIKV